MAQEQLVEFDDAEELARSVGGAIRAARAQAGLTLGQVARSCGLSTPFLSQVENGKAMPSILTLHRVARTLGTTAHALLMVGDASASSIVRAGEGPTVSFADDTSIRARFLVRPGHGLAASEVHAPAAAGLREPIQQEGFKLYHVLEGELAFTLGTGRETRLGPGDTLCHDGSVPHRWWVPGDDGARFLVVSTSSL